MSFSSYNQSRVSLLNKMSPNVQGEYVLYWMQAYRRLFYNHSLDFALSLAKNYKKPLVVYEGLRIDYPWNSERIHRFVLEGMQENFQTAKERGFTYWSFVETKNNPAKGLLKKISEKALAIVTDNFPCFIIPEQTKKLSQKIDCPLYTVDGNGIIPLKLYGSFASAARILRPRIHSLFPEAYLHTANPNPTPHDLPKYEAQPPFITWNPNEESIDQVLSKISFKNQVPAPRRNIGGRKIALNLLENFLCKNLLNYGEGRSNPHSPEKSPSTGLSPYLHFGYISIDEIVISVLNWKSKEKWAPDLLNSNHKGKKQGYFHKENSICDFLDELLTWRDIGYLTFFLDPSFNKDLKILPDWVKNNIAVHEKDKREYVYTKEQLRYAKTHDPVWNAAQKELLITGKMHNYMRMLWGKKVMEWTSNFEEAFEILEDFNNLYAIDGRNPNSYTGILWCFGLFDRPWFPERNVFGNIRYMSSDSTLRKFDMKEYFGYVDSLENRTLF